MPSSNTSCLSGTSKQPIQVNSKLFTYFWFTLVFFVGFFVFLGGVLFVCLFVIVVVEEGEGRRERGFYFCVLFLSL